jgi:hypothetical protein
MATPSAEEGCKPPEKPLPPTHITRFLRWSARLSWEEYTTFSLRGLMRIEWDRDMSKL